MEQIQPESCPMVVEITIPDKEKSAMEDKLWVNEFNGGNENAFNWIVLKHKNPVFNLCYRFLNNHDDANEVAQECFVKVWKNLKGFRGDAKFSTWLYRIVINACKNRVSTLAYKARKQSSPLELQQRENDGDDSPPDVMERKQRGMQVHDCISKLDKAHREIVLLRDIEDKTYQEISEITDVNLGTLKSRLARARVSLKTCLEGLIL